MKNIYLLAILVFAALLFSFKLPDFPLFGVDEPRYAETAREMMERNDFVIPYCNYEPRYDKPVLFYWEEILSFKLFGLNEFAARLPSVIAGLGMIVLAFLLGNIQGIGILSSLIMLSSLGIVLFSKLSITDMSLCFFISGSLAFFYLGYSNRSVFKRQSAFKKRTSSLWLVSSLVMMGLGFLCKGPISVLLPIIVIVPFLFWQQDIKGFILDTYKDLLKGLVSFLIIVLPWYLSVHFATNGDFTREFFLNHNLKRYIETVSNHDGPWWFYVPALLVGFFPWSAFLPQAIVSNVLSTEPYRKNKTTISNPIVSFCLWWALVVFLFFSVAQTKLVTYILPAYLPLTIVLAKWWSDKFNILRTRPLKNIDALIGLGVLVLVSATGAYLALTVFREKLLAIDPSTFFIPIMIIAFILISSATIAMTAVLKKPRVAFIFITCAISIVYSIAIHFIMVPFANYLDAGVKNFMREVRAENQGPNYRLVSLKTPLRSNFYFYAKKNIPNVSKKKLLKLLQGKTYFITTQENLENFDLYFTGKTAAAADNTSADPPANVSLPYQIIKRSRKYVFAKSNF